MASGIVYGLGFVAVVEGLALALAPGRLRGVLEALDRLGPEGCRAFGLAAIALGTLLLWLASA